MGIKIGELIWSEREKAEVSAELLSEGIGSRQMLRKLEQDQIQSDKLLCDILLQRLGKSPDKLECILNWQEYRLECIRDWFEECVFKKNKKWAERALWLYEQKVPKTRVHQMYRYRCRGMIAYWIDEDLEQAEQYFAQAVEVTFPFGRERSWRGHRISTIELENLLALSRVQLERAAKGTIPKEVKERLAKCAEYTSAYLTDEAEYAKYFSKYAWLAAGIAYREQKYQQALELCRDAINLLREYSIEYMLRPLLSLALQCKERLVMANRELQDKTSREQEYSLGIEHYTEYLACLQSLHYQFGKAWYPENSLLHNCCQKSYHLEFEIFRAERYAHGMTQAMVSEGIYENPKEIAKIENIKSSPNEKHYTELMERFGLDKERVGGFVITDSFEVLELRKKIATCISKRYYDEVKPYIRALEKKLDMQYLENRRTIAFLKNIIAYREKKRPYDEIIREDWELLQETYMLTPEQIHTIPEWKLKKGKRITYRAPFRNEGEILNQIALVLERTGNGEEGIALQKWGLYMCERSRVKKKYHYYVYGLLLKNIAGSIDSVEEGIRGVCYELGCGKLNDLGYNYLSLACALENKPETRELCRRMIREAYYLYELANRYADQRVTKDYYEKEYGGSIQEI